MQREILFKGKPSPSSALSCKKEWVYGFYFVEHFEEHGDYIPYHFIIEDNVSIEVIPETVGQYTGLQDKNGVKIFEGDKVKVDIGRPYETIIAVEYGYIPASDDMGIDCYGFPVMGGETEEVIGNIHETQSA